MQMDVLPTGICSLLQQWEGSDQRQATKAVEGAQRLAQPNDDLEADAGTGGEVIAPELHKYFTLAKSMGCEFVDKTPGATPAPQDVTSVKGARPSLSPPVRPHCFRAPASSPQHTESDR